MNLDAAVTIKVITNRISPGSINAATVVRDLPQRIFVRQRGSDAVARYIQRRAVELVGVADDKSDRHRFTQSTAQPQHNAADHAILVNGSTMRRDNFPCSRYRADSFHHYRRLLEDVAHNRRNVG